MRHVTHVNMSNTMTFWALIDTLYMSDMLGMCKILNMLDIFYIYIRNTSDILDMPSTLYMNMLFLGVMSGPTNMFNALEKRKQKG